LGVALAACAAAQPAGVKLPAYTREVLPNGVVLSLMERRGAPLLDLRAVIRGGAESDPEDLAGLTSVVAEMLRRGSRTRTSDQSAEELDQMGATLETSTTPQCVAILAESLPGYAARLVDLVADAILRPAFPEDELAKVVTRHAEEARAVKDSPGAAVWRYFRAFYFGSGHPYGRPRWGDELSVRRITRPLVVEHYQRMFVGRNLVFTAAGDFDRQAMRSLLVNALGELPPGEPYRPLPDSPPVRPPGRRVLLVDKPDATQTNLLIGFPGIHRTHPDRVALWLVNTIFGGRFTSNLNEDLRIESGLTYGAYSYFNQNRLTGAIVVSTFTPVETTAEALDHAVNALVRFRQQGISAAQLASAKNFVKGTYPPESLQTCRQLATLLGELELYGFGRDEIDDLYSRIDAVTLKQANAAVNTYFGAKNFDLVVLGNASRIRGALRKYAARIVEIPIRQPGFGVSLRFRQ
jgi:predicted Zn-dependent peptidase